MSPNDINPIGDRVFIKVLDEVQEYHGQISLMEHAKEKSNFAEVISVYNKDCPIKVGEKVIYNKHSGSIIVFDKFDKEAPEYRLISINDILAQINDS